MNFLGGLHIQLVGIELHPVGIADRFSRLQAQHEFVRVRIFFLEVVAIVGADERDIQLLVNFQQSLIRDALMLQAVGLQFEIVIFLAEDFPMFTCRLRGSCQVALPDQIGNLTAQAS